MTVLRVEHPPAGGSHGEDINAMVLVYQRWYERDQHYQDPTATATYDRAANGEVRVLVAAAGTVASLSVPAASH